MILSLDNWWIAPNLLDVDIFQEIFSERSKLGAEARGGNTSLSIFWIISFPKRVKNLIRRSLNSAPPNKPHHPNQFVDLFCRLGRAFLIILHIQGDYVTGSLPPSQTRKKQVVYLAKITRALIVYYDAKVTLLCTLCTLENKMRTKRLFITIQRSPFFNSLTSPQSPTPNPSSL